MKEEQSILAEALELVEGDRNDAYGHPADDFARTAAIWSAILGTPVTASQVGLCMIGVKLSRETHQPKRDNLVDIAGYAQTVAMVRQREAKAAGITYLASPYTHPDAAVREARYQAACRMAASMIRDGKHVFSPIVLSHPLAELGLPSQWEDWEAFDRSMIGFCSELVVLRLPGWSDSEGVLAEIGIARDLGKPVRFVDPVADDRARPGSPSPVGHDVRPCGDVPVDGVVYRSWGEGTPSLAEIVARVARRIETTNE